ncbi:MAG TPA: DUF2239 family protein, partial [Capsulimonadaceae bacterium]|nr:DUF2239 family protein [Capsulimonadaceae bacterium]
YNNAVPDEQKQGKGRPQIAGLKRYNVLLEEALIEWARKHPGGLSAFLRRLMREEKERERK